MPVRVLEAIGGFASVRNLLAEDQAIGIRVRKAGYAIRLSHHVIENVNQDRSFRWFLNRHSRWFKIRRRLALPTFLIEPAFNLAVVGLVWALSGESGLAWGGLLVLVGLGIVRDAVQARRLRGTFPRLRHLAAQPGQGPVPPAGLVRRADQSPDPLARPPVPGRQLHPAPLGPGPPERPAAGPAGFR